MVKRQHMTMIALRAILMNPYSTHLPILQAIGRVLGPDIHNVVEFGGGVFSTPTFLNRNIYPALKGLVTYEGGERWRDRISEIVGIDSRLQLKGHYGADIEAFCSWADLIFIDDGLNVGQRVSTINRVLEFFSMVKRLHCPIVIHDFEVAEYRQVVFNNNIFNFNEFSGLIPTTVILWYGGFPELKPIERAYFSILEGLNETNEIP